MEKVRSLWRRSMFLRDGREPLAPRDAGSCSNACASRIQVVRLGNQRAREPPRDRQRPRVVRCEDPGSHEDYTKQNRIFRVADPALYR